MSVVIQDATGGVPDADDAAIWAEGLGLTYPVVADVDASFQPVWDPDLVLPVAYVVDRDGVVTWGEIGGAGGLDEMEAQVLSALDDGS